ncbi:hypothetical protein BV898_12490 [Hypsibius exemplaris]|uniref:Uncharacterized protein n=1 Tax=Hypsibius exemplaris TaxID=2072580 RepID=A0A1W0WDJ9_HYPEX|nr:hypothetical protein BV898_12490 [Hypsibius exemplaris]
MKSPIDFDRPIGAATWQALPQVGLYVVLTLAMGLPTQKTCWKKQFKSNAVNSCAAKMLLLKACFVLQAVLLSSLSSDLIFQLAKNPKAVPQIPGLWITPVTFLSSIVLMTTHSAMSMRNHLMQSLSVAVIPSLVLVIAKFSPVSYGTLELNMLLIYTVSMVAVFWKDVKDFVMEHHIAFPFNFGASKLKDDIGNTSPFVSSPGLNHVEMSTPHGTPRSERVFSKSPAGREEVIAPPISGPGLQEKRERERREGPTKSRRSNKSPKESRMVS